jgi:hypothetical protein
MTTPRPPYTVFLVISINSAGHIAHADIKLSNWPDGYLLIKNGTPDQPTWCSGTSASTGTQRKGRSRRSTSGYQWMPICAVENFWDWRMAVNFWHLWTNSGEVGPGRLGRYGLTLFARYGHQSHKWNHGHQLRMLVINCKYNYVKTYISQHADSLQLCPAVATTQQSPWSALVEVYV